MPPVLAQPGAAPQLVWDGRPPPLGTSLGGPPDRVQAELALERGARLLLYTDGLVEQRTRSLNGGLARLLQEIERRADASVSELVAALPAALLDAQSVDDDVCLLALQYAP